jgi:hypothetical protein
MTPPYGTTIFGPLAKKGIGKPRRRMCALPKMSFEEMDTGMAAIASETVRSTNEILSGVGAVRFWTIRSRMKLLAPIAISIFVYAVVLFAPLVLGDGDTWLHIAVGQWIVQHQAVPWVDPFSLTFAGAPWGAHEWLAELAMAVAYAAAGVSGVLILTACCAALAAWLLARHLQLWLDPFVACVVLIFGLGCIVSGLLARPHVLALPLMELWTAGLVMARSRDRAPALWLLPVMTIWANLHGSFAFGLALALVLGLEAVTAGSLPRWRAARAWGGFFVAAVTAALLTPYGFHGLIFPLQLLSLRHLADILEWQSMDFSHLQPFEIALLALLYVCLSRGVRIPRVRLLLLLGLLYMVLSHARHQVLVGVVVPLLLAEPLARALCEQSLRNLAEPRRAAIARTLASLTVLAALTGFRLAHPAALRDALTSPISALAHIPAEQRAQPVFNEYAFGGALILEGIKPFIDGRAELYGDDFLGAYFDMMNNPNRTALEEALGRYGVTWTILVPWTRPAALLDTLPGWRRVYADKFAVIHVRADAGR